jgi:hypothetical protein
VNYRLTAVCPCSGARPQYGRRVNYRAAGDGGGSDRLDGDI